MKEKKEDMVFLLLAWYRRARRDLSWRHTCDPYRIWVSEIILQQTRVAQGMDYYRHFLERFPDVKALAAASVDEVMKVWEGLGYYSRARNMHAAAQYLVQERRGVFPGSYRDLLLLRGVGPYTAAAIASIAFGEVVPVLDGNVFRVIARLYGVALPRGSAGDREVRHITRRLIPREAPGDFNQALMELGALVCTPVPDCDACPLHHLCVAHRRGLTRRLPVTSSPPKTVKRYFHYLVVTCCGEILVSQRSEKDIWQLLWEFPVVETDRKEMPEKVTSLFEERTPGITGGAKPLFSGIIHHQLTHRTIVARFYHVTLRRWPPALNGRWKKIPVDRLATLAFPRLITGYMEAFPERFSR